MARDDDVDDDLIGVIPAGFAAVVPKRGEGDPEELRPHSFEALKGEHVVVRSNGFDVRGVLVGADEGELYLRGEMRWVVLPLHTITSVRRQPPPDRPLGGPRDWPGDSTRDEDDE
jgi:hypothetical protein